MKTSTSFRKEIKEDNAALMKAREIIKSDFQSKFDLEKNIHDFVNFGLSGANLDVNALNHAISLYTEGKALIDSERDGATNNYSSNPNSSIRFLVNKIFEIVSMKKEEQLKHDLKKLTTKDKAVVLKHIEEIQHNKLNISEDTLKKLHDLVK